MMVLNPGDIARGSLTAEQVAEYTNALTRHYGERVAPVSSVCNAIDTYVKTLVENDSNGPYDPVAGAAIRKYGPTIVAFASKSNLLARLIYGGESLRTEKCPVHDGHWSGCEWPIPCGCGDGNNVTGWLKETR